MTYDQSLEKRNWFSRRSVVLLVVVALVALLFITDELRVPFLLLLACPLMHMLMHRGHGKHNSDSGPH
jgi:Flp pilus assembly protein TadB